MASPDGSPRTRAETAAVPGGLLQEVLARFAEQHRALSSARAQMNGLSVTALSRDGVVEATVGADGSVSAIRFTGSGYRELSAPALAESVLEALATARTEAAARAAAITLSLESRLPAVPAPPPPSEPVPGGPAVPEQPATCWRRLLRQARALAQEAEQPSAQRPLWGRDHPSPQRHGPLPADLRDAVAELRDAVCGAVQGGPCGARGCARPDTPRPTGDTLHR